MLGRDEAASVQEAVELIRANLPHISPGVQTVQIENAFFRVLAEDVFSPEDLPGFARSTVDGFAVGSASTFGATESSPAYLSVAGEIRMGAEPAFGLGAGEAAGIPTGGMLPDGADSVLMLEHAREMGKDMLEAHRAVAPGENVIGKGEDVRKGQPVLKCGIRLRAEDVAVLAGLGITNVPLYERPAVSVMSTGDEVVAAASPLRAGLVRDMNSYSLAGHIISGGGTPLMKGIIGDDYGLLKEAVGQSIADSAMLLISGGSSVGQKDMTARIIADMGRVLFHNVSIKPGKPTIFGLIGGIPVFGLPGHPRAVTVCFDVFIRPVLEHLCGLRAGSPPSATLRAKITKSVHSAPGRQEHISVFLEKSGGELLATPILGKSGLITTLVRANGMVVIPASQLGIERNEIVEVGVTGPVEGLP